jgi:hypothetical protein
MLSPMARKARRARFTDSESGKPGVEARIDDGNVRSLGKQVAVFAANALAEVEVGALCEWIAFR